MVAVLIRFLTFPLCFALLLSRDAQVRADNRIDLDTSDQVAFLIGSNTTSGSVNQIITPDLSEYVQQLREQWNIPGMTLGVVHSGGKVELEAWGQRTEDGDEMTTDTLFNLASCSKAFAASAIGILMDDFTHGRNITPLPQSIKRFEWETKVVDLLPDDWELMDEWATRKATVQDVLSHVSGLPRHDFSYRLDDSPLDVVRRMRHLRTAYELRQQWSYNNQMYMLASYLVSKYSGVSYIDFVQTRIFNKLQMTSTTFHESKASHSGKLTQTWTKSGRRIPFWFPDDLAEVKAGPGGIISSVDDMVSWVKMLLNGGVNIDTGVSVVPGDVLEKITGAHVMVGPTPRSEAESIRGYGMGWERVSYHGYDVVAHSGGNPGFSTHVAFLPQHDLGVVILVNADEKGDAVINLLHRIIDSWLVKNCEPGNKPNVSIKPNPEHPSDSTDLSPPSLELEAYAGTYSDAGYGSIVLCTPNTNTPHCRNVLKDFEPFPNPFAHKSSPILYAAYQTTLSTHVRLRHQQGDAFGITMTYLFPNGYGRDSTAFETYESGESEGKVNFVVSDQDEVVGFGLFIMEELTERRRLGGTIEEIADVWFTKVSTPEA